MRKPKTKVDVLEKKRTEAEKKLDRYERMVTLYFNKMKAEQKRVRYYQREVERALKSAPKTHDPTRVVEA